MQASRGYLCERAAAVGGEHWPNFYGMREADFSLGRITGARTVREEEKVMPTRSGRMKCRERHPCTLGGVDRGSPRCVGDSRWEAAGPRYLAGAQYAGASTVGSLYGDSALYEVASKDNRGRDRKKTVSCPAVRA
jgi:hypothetical protein